MKEFPLIVPYNYLPTQFSDYEEILGEWKGLIRSAEFTLGPYVEKFENEFAEYVGARYCVSTNNGTDALILGLRALGIDSGDEVITPTNSFYATTGAIVAVGATPVFCDVDDRYQIDTKDARKRVTSRTKALLPVHWAGASPDMENLMSLAQEFGLPVIEDACMAIGAKTSKGSPGTFGAVGAFSMHPLKSLNVMGDGGMAVTDDIEVYNWMLKYRNHGMINRDEIDFWGVNMRLQPIQAIVASHMLKTLDERLERRRRLQAIYDQRLSKLSRYLTVPPRNAGNLETVSLYMFLSDRRDELVAHLISLGIEAKVHYPTPLHLQKPGLKMGYKLGDLPVAETQASRLVTIPAHEYLSDTQIEFCMHAIEEFFGASE